jgi:hypothetical protein
MRALPVARAFHLFDRSPGLSQAKIRSGVAALTILPDFASLNPGYSKKMLRVQ